MPTIVETGLADGDDGYDRPNVLLGIDEIERWVNQPPVPTERVFPVIQGLHLVEPAAHALNQQAFASFTGQTLVKREAS